MIFKRLDGIAESPEIDPTHMIFKKGAKQYREGNRDSGILNVLLRPSS